MSLDDFVPLFSALISFAGLMLLVVQLRAATRQREAESLVKLSDINRELLSLGFDHPQLFAVLEDAAGTDPVWERRYLQLWLNQLYLVHLYLKRTVVDHELRQSLQRSLADFMTLKNMRRHWQRDRAVYSDSFQTLVDGIIEIDQPPEATAASHESRAEHLAGDLLERRARHPHETLAGRRGQDGVLRRSGNETLHEHVAVVGEDGGRTQAAITQFWKLPVFPDDFLNRHFSGIFEFFRSLKQNYSFCCTEPGGAFV